MKNIFFIFCYILVTSIIVCARPVVDQVNDEYLSGTWSTLAGHYNYQSFQTDAGNILGAEVMVVGGNYTGDLIINIFDSIDGNILASGATVIDRIQVLTWVYVDFGTSVDLLSDTTYFLGISANSDTVRLGVSFDYSFPHGYEHGTAYYLWGTDSIVADYNFRTYADVLYTFPWSTLTPAIIGAGKKKNTSDHK